nr:T-cell receptor delta chain VDJ junction region [mice, liver, gamma delta T cells, 95BLT-1, Peptide Partial, 18 aa] [Mus sp.]
ALMERAAGAYRRDSADKL